MRLNTIKLEEYVLSFDEFKIERSRKESLNQLNLDNEASFKKELESGRLDRYQGTYVAYKDGILCGQSVEEEILKENVNFMLCTPNIRIFYIQQKKN